MVRRLQFQAGVTALNATAVRQPMIVLATFLAVQVLDGLLTYWGVREFGVHVEGNDLVVTTMHLLGPAPALFATKCFACLCGLILYVTERHRPLAVAAGGYIGLAVFPWMTILSAVR